tara:strand:- start:11 stop:499 length:489 start_codon:yes stop_codon:yes gene_type:complete
MFKLKGRNSKNLPAPVGYEKPSLSVTKGPESAGMMTESNRIATANKQMMNIAWSPAKNILTTGFMLYMTGNSIQIFSIYSTGMALYNPIKSMVGVTTVFKRFEGDGVDTLMPSLIYIGLQLALLAVALWKCNSMGLLPMTSADWISSIPIRKNIETTIFPSS